MDSTDLWKVSLMTYSSLARSCLDSRSCTSNLTTWLSWTRLQSFQTWRMRYCPECHLPSPRWTFRAVRCLQWSLYSYRYISSSSCLERKLWWANVYPATSVVVGWGNGVRMAISTKFHLSSNPTSHTPQLRVCVTLEYRIAGIFRGYGKTVWKDFANLILVDYQPLAHACMRY